MTPREKIVLAIENGIQKIESVFNPLIAGIDLKIGILEKAGQDPSKYFDLDENSFVDYPALREAYANEKEKTIAEFSQKMDAELKKLDEAEESQEEESEIPWAEIAFYLIKSALENGVKIKVGDVEWDSTKPLGGEGSVFDDLRNASMRGMGIDPDSDLGKFIKDPINSISELGENIDAETEKALTDIKKASDKALTDAKRETDKALTDAKKATDKALTDVKRETDKALTEARKAAEKVVKKAVEDVVKKLPKVKVKVKIKPPTIKW